MAVFKEKKLIKVKSKYFAFFGLETISVLLFFCSFISFFNVTISSVGSFKILKDPYEGSFAFRREREKIESYSLR